MGELHECDWWRRTDERVHEAGRRVCGNGSVAPALVILRCGAGGAERRGVVMLARSGSCKGKSVERGAVGPVSMLV